MEIERYVETTVGDLITVLAEEASILTEDKNEINILVAFMIWDLFYNSGKASERSH
jgi:hypothetical protein